METTIWWWWKVDDESKLISEGFKTNTNDIFRGFIHSKKTKIHFNAIELNGNSLIEIVVVLVALDHCQ